MKQIDIILTALDKTGTALADHNHKWTSDERASYEKAVRVLKSLLDK